MNSGLIGHEGIERAGIVKRLEEFLDHYDRVILMMEPFAFQAELTEHFQDHFMGHHTDRRILLLSSKDGVEQGDVAVVADEPQSRSAFGIYCITPQERDTLLDLYHLYDFSDQFRVLAEEPYYGGLLNLVKTGVFTEDEVFEALIR